MKKLMILFMFFILINFIGGCSKTIKPKPDDSLVGTETLKEENSKQTVEVTQQGTQGLKVTFKDVLFKFNDIRLKPAAFPTLDKVVTLLNENSSALVVINGYTDSIGTDKANLKISKGRAQGVANYLISKGISAARISVAGKGKSNPVAPNNNKLNRQKNRRVEILITAPKYTDIKGKDVSVTPTPTSKEDEETTTVDEESDNAQVGEESASDENSPKEKGNKHSDSNAAKASSDDDSSNASAS